MIQKTVKLSIVDTVSHQKRCAFRPPPNDLCWDTTPERILPEPGLKLRRDSPENHRLEHRASPHPLAAANRHFTCASVASCGVEDDSGPHESAHCAFGGALRTSFRAGPNRGRLSWSLKRKFTPAQICCFT